MGDRRNLVIGVLIWLAIALAGIAYASGYRVASTHERVLRHDFSVPTWPAPLVERHERHFQTAFLRWFYSPMVWIESRIRGEEIESRTHAELEAERQRFAIEL